MRPPLDDLPRRAGPPATLTGTIAALSVLVGVLAVLIAPTRTLPIVVAAITVVGAVKLGAVGVAHVSSWLPRKLCIPHTEVCVPLRPAGH